MDERKPPAPRSPNECDDGRRDENPPEPPPAKITPVKERIGENADNLRRRRAWFRKRSSDSE
jgi:hypothetical protein